MVALDSAPTRPGTPGSHIGSGILHLMTLQNEHARRTYGVWYPNESCCLLRFKRPGEQSAHPANLYLCKSVSCHRGLFHEPATGRAAEPSLVNLRLIGLLSHASEHFKAWASSICRVPRCSDVRKSKRSSRSCGCGGSWLRIGVWTMGRITTLERCQQPHYSESTPGMIEGTTPNMFT